MSWLNLEPGAFLPVVMAGSVPAAGDVLNATAGAGGGEPGQQEHIAGAAEGNEVLSKEIVEGTIGAVTLDFSERAVGAQEIFEVVRGGGLGRKPFKGVGGARPQQIGADIDNDERKFESFTLVNGEDVEVIAGQVISE